MSRRLPQCARAARQCAVPNPARAPAAALTPGHLVATCMHARAYESVHSQQRGREGEREGGRERERKGDTHEHTICLSLYLFHIKQVTRCDQGDLPSPSSSTLHSCAKSTQLCTSRVSDCTRETRSSAWSSSACRLCVCASSIYRYISLPGTVELGM